MNNYSPFLSMAAMIATLAACDSGDSNSNPNDKCHSFDGGGNDNPLICTHDNFQVGAALDGSISEDPRGLIAAQGVSDYAVAVASLREELTTACRAIALDLDASRQDVTAAESVANRDEKAIAWCNLASTQIASFRGSTTLKVNFEPPACSRQVSPDLSCQAQCTAELDCDVRSEPARCEGGILEIACSGGCGAWAGIAVNCEGSCEGACQGSCEVLSGSVACAGKCAGSCVSGIQPDGTCMGECVGRCDVVAHGALCSGLCLGKCNGSCKGLPNARAKCDGNCDTEYEPLNCRSGSTLAGCQIDVDCFHGCQATAMAQSVCKPVELIVMIQGEGQPERLLKLKTTIEANYGVIIAASSRLGLLEYGGVHLAGTITRMDTIKEACIPVVLKTMTGAVASVKTMGPISASLIALVY